MQIVTTAHVRGIADSYFPDRTKHCSSSTLQGLLLIPWLRMPLWLCWNVLVPSPHQ